MEEYLVPTQYGEDEFIEKKSRFIGRVWPVETEEEALAKIQEMKKQHYDATHNCWAYIIHGGAVRFSDDGEPGGTAGMPMLQVLQREGLPTACREDATAVCRAAMHDKKADGGAVTTIRVRRIGSFYTEPADEARLKQDYEEVFG